jgi:hypothetical protein
MNGTVEPPPTERVLDQRAPLVGRARVGAGAGNGVDDGNDLHDSLL